MDNFRVAFQNTYELQATAVWEKKRAHRWGILNCKFLSDPMKWPLMFDHISLSKQPCSPSVRKHLRIRVQQLSPGPLLLLLVHCHRGIFSSWSPGCPSPSDIRHSLRLLPSRLPTHPRVRWCLRVKLTLSLCACVFVCMCVCMCVYTQNFLETWSYKLAEGGRWAFIPLMTCASLEWFPDKAAEIKSLGTDRSPQPTWRPSFTLKTQAGWGLGSSFSDDGNLAFPTSLFPALTVPVFFLLPLPGGVPRSPPGALPSLCCWPRLFWAQQLPSNTLAFYLHSFSPSPSSCPLSYPATHLNHNLSEPLSSTNKGQIFFNFSFKVSHSSGFSSIFLSSFPSLLLPLQIFSFLPLLLHSGVWTELRITNVCLEKPYLKQTNKRTHGLVWGCSLNGFY